MWNAEIEEVFYVTQKTWLRTFALVVSVQGKTEGELEGEAPYYVTVGKDGRREKCKVVLDCYDSQTRKFRERSTTKNGGTYNWRLTGFTEKLRKVLETEGREVERG